LVVRILILGAAGQVGRHLVVALAHHDVRASPRDGRDGTIAADVADLAALASLVRAEHPDVIVNAAADAYVERCEREPEATRRINVAPVELLAAEAMRIGARLVVFSSEYVFDGSRERCTEEDPIDPINEYGAQKAAIEEHARRTERHLVCRTSGVYGAEAARKNFVWQVVDTLRAERRFRAPHDQLVTPTYAPSLAATVSALLDRAATGTFHIAGPRIIERDSFAREIADVFGLDGALVEPVSTAELGLSAARPRVGLSDAKLRQTLGAGTTDAREALRELAATESRTT
jgi:dTDP-4-dehydrorhamnose reductase